LGKNGIKETKHMKRSILASSVAACFYICLTGPLFAAQPALTSAVSHPSSNEKNVIAVKPAEKCLSDLRTFDGQMQRDGYWLGGSGNGYGYPMEGFSYGLENPMNDRAAASTTGYQDARPGYEVRMLVASANILAQHGQQQLCENVLVTIRDIYKLYVADMHNRGVRTADTPSWRQKQIVAAEPVTSKNISFRSDELLGTDVRNPQNEALGSVEDLVMSPQTGKIAYLVIARGGIFGIDEKYVPVPWEDFKISPNVNLLVLDTTKVSLNGAPRVSKDQFATPGQFDPESRKIDTYWKAHLAGTSTNGTRN
jgi:sporulation protein YlmC with PRC-barrel domain